MKIIALSADEQPIDGKGASASAEFPEWMDATLFEIGLPGGAQDVDPKTLHALTQKYLEQRVSVEADDALGRNAMTLHRVATMGVIKGAHMVRLIPNPEVRQ